MVGCDVGESHSLGGKAGRLLASLELLCSEGREGQTIALVVGPRLNLVNCTKV